jgi:hypothetical protein
LAAQDEGQGAPPALPAQEQPEVLSRGPVHEAFAEPINMEPQAGLMAPEAPPPNLEEIPPTERPQGQQFAWIPGYWSWDPDRNRYIWVSACWRAVPPSMSWVPGYWSERGGEWEWMAGFWAPAGVREFDYLPAPPAVEDVAPPGAPPSLDSMWVPPCMYWTGEQYVRRAGYCLVAQPDWVWVPSHYVVTPRGFIFAEGHWDYALERRGVLFAPVYLPASLYARSEFTYSPSIVIDLGLLRTSLFAYPRYSHYYFGDYYDDAYLRLGIYPWFDSQRLHTWYDPIYEHDRWQSRRSEPRWEQRERDTYNRRRADRDLRPARTYREQESRMAKLPEPQRRALQVARPMAVAIASRDAALKFTRLNSEARHKVSKQASAVRTFRDERTRWESAAARPKATPSAGAHEAAATLPAARREAARPPAERKAVAPAPSEHREAARPPSERKAVAPAPSEHREAAQPPTERKAVAPAPSEHREAAQPPTERKAAAAAATARRESAVAPPRVARAPQAERVQIPVPPSVGRSAGVLGIFRKGPPARPADEDKDSEGKDSRKKRGG